MSDHDNNNGVDISEIIDLVLSIIIDIIDSLKS